MNAHNIFYLYYKQFNGYGGSTGIPQKHNSRNDNSPEGQFDESTIPRKGVFINKFMRFVVVLNPFFSSVQRHEL